MTLNDATLTSRIHSIATRDLVGFLKQHGDFVYTERDELGKRAKIAEAVISVCRRVVGPPLLTFSTAARTFRSTNAVHDDWDSKFLKVKVSGGDASSSSDDLELIPDLTHMTRKRGRGSTKPQSKDNVRDTPTKKPKPTVKPAASPPIDSSNISQASGQNVVDLKARFLFQKIIYLAYRQKSNH